MSWKATAAVKGLTRDARGRLLTAREKLLLFVLADYHNDEKRGAWAGLSALAKASLTSRRHTVRLLERLAESGRRLIAKEPRPQKTNFYRLLFAGDPKPPSEAAGTVSELSSPRSSDSMSPGVVTPLRHQGSDIAMSPEPPPSHQEARAAQIDQAKLQGELPSQTVENPERQFNQQLKAPDGENSLPQNWWPRNQLRADLFGGLHSGSKGKTGMHEIAKTFFDSRRLTFNEQLRACVSAAVTTLSLARTGKLMVLDANDIEKRAVSKLKSAGETLHTFELVQDFASRSRHVTQYVARIVVESAAELLEEIPYSPQTLEQGKQTELVVP